MNPTLPPQLQRHHPVAVNRTDDDLTVVRPFTLAVFPQLSVGLGIESSETVFTGNEDVGLAVVLDELMASERFVCFGPDSLAEARNRGYRLCRI